VARAANSRQSKTNKSSAGKGESKAADGKSADAKRGNAKGGNAKGAPARKAVAKRSRPQKGRAAAKKERKGLGKFLREVRIELGKVTWPTRKDLMQSTIVVLVAVAIAATVIGLYDLAFSEVVRVITPG
jgi:preprotein translocase subunit SecE